MVENVGRLASHIVIFLIIGIIVKFSWNWLIPSIFGLRSINYWEALGLIILVSGLMYLTKDYSKK